ncbi:hypothetical protein PoB_007706200 [Plakobranchus ocellatus]|uniref:Uncharacterized protein n=1 Tax=Plakobranchus ocellatus TaxID=259542 RepID=A0AAV4E2R9_9GAST|nr:hypothetical protein PoB_007706200 [Plakobranchus ocellatus]
MAQWVAIAFCRGFEPHHRRPALTGGLKGKDHLVDWLYIQNLNQTKQKQFTQKDDLRLSGPPSGRGAGGGTRTRDRRVNADLKADSLTTVPPTPPNWRRSFSTLQQKRVANNFPPLILYINMLDCFSLENKSGVALDYNISKLIMTDRWTYQLKNNNSRNLKPERGRDPHLRRETSRTNELADNNLEPFKTGSCGADEGMRRPLLDLSLISCLLVIKTFTFSSGQDG